MLEQNHLVRKRVLQLQATKIFVNGVWTGIHRKPQELVATLRQMRRQVTLPCTEALTFHAFFQ